MDQQRRKEQLPDVPDGSVGVFVYSDEKDGEVANDLIETIAGAGYAVYQPPDESAESAAWIEETLPICDGVIVVYGNCSPYWVGRQLQTFRKYSYRIKKEMKVIAVFDPPPPTEKQKRVPLILPKMIRLTADQLDKFFDQLQMSSDGTT